MNRKSFIVISLVLFVVTILSFTACCNEMNTAQYSVSYSVTTGGYIDGETIQTISYGKSASTVTAIPYSGYIFVGWSDNRTIPTRTDTNIRSNLEITAVFERIKRKTFTYVYNQATGNDTTESVELRLEDLPQTSLVVPEREDYIFCGWYLDWLFTVQISDEFGKLVMNDEIFGASSSQLFAKWIAVDAPTYEILMVYVTEVNAILETTDGESVEVDYKMTEMEKQIYEVLSEMFGQYLNALLNGLVDFKVDTYFTTESLGNENFQRGATHPLGNNMEIVYNYNIFGYSIPEIDGVAGSGVDWSTVGGKLSNYGSVITTFGMNDYDSLLHVVAGTAGTKYASIHQETLFGGLLGQGFYFDYLLNLENQGVPGWWEAYMQLYLHEFTHTVEFYPENLAYNGADLDYHYVSNYYGNLYGSISQGLGTNQPGISEIEIIRLFLLNRTIVDGRTVGIPKNFW